MTDDTSTLSLNEVADELGVHYMTAYRYVRLGMLDAHQEGRSWVVRRADLDRFRSDDDEESSGADWVERLVARMLAADTRGAWSVVQAAMASGTSPLEVYVDILVPALREIGDRWHRGEVDVAQEHTASRVAERLLGNLETATRKRGARRGTVLMGSTQTELHSLPVSIAADIVRLAQYQVIEIGTNLPPEQFAAAVERTPDLVAVAVGVTTSGQNESVRATVHAIRTVTDRPVFVGGNGIDAASAKEAGATAYTLSASDLVNVLDALPDSDQTE